MTSKIILKYFSKILLKILKHWSILWLKETVLKNSCFIQIKYFQLCKSVKQETTFFIVEGRKISWYPEDFSDRIIQELLLKKMKKNVHNKHVTEINLRKK